MELDELKSESVSKKWRENCTCFILELAFVFLMEDVLTACCCKL
jgi:hypothetical protein